jgi:hypothetical protein
MSGLEFFEIMYSEWELLKVVLVALILVTMLRILHGLRDLKASDLRESRRMSRRSATSTRTSTADGPQPLNSQTTAPAGHRHFPTCRVGAPAPQGLWPAAICLGKM